MTAVSTASANGSNAEFDQLVTRCLPLHQRLTDSTLQFDEPYHAPRPVSAITLADTDGNDATVSDATWTPVLPTRNHREYPAAHSCTSGGLGETLFQFYGTRTVMYTWDSKATATTRTYAHTDARSDESRIARIYGGMHFDCSTVAGVALGIHVAQWVGAHHFGRKE